MAQTKVGRTGVTERVSVEIVEGVAKREGVDPLQLTSPFYDEIDPEALEALFADPISGERRDGVSLTFRYCGYEIAIDGERGVQVRTP